MRFHDWIGYLGSVLRRDVRYAFRSIGRTKAYSVLSFVMLAVGIAGATAAVTLVDAALVRPLPFPNPDALVRITIDSSIDGRSYQADPSVQQMEAWKAQAGVFVDIAASAPTTPFVITDNVPVRTALYQTWAMTSSHLALLGLSPTIGRSFGAPDMLESSPPVGLIGYRYYLKHFGADPGVLGRSVHIRERGKDSDGAVTIVGVLPRDYWRDVILVVPMRRPDGYHRVIARLGPGVTLGSAQKALSSTVAPGPAGPVRLSPLEGEAALERNPSRLWFLLAATLAPLVLACVNVAALGLAAGFTRQRELSIRAAMGASRSRLITQIVIEHVVVAVIAAIGGLVLNILFLDWFVESLGPGLTPMDARLRLDLPTLTAVTVVVIVTGVLVGLVPAFRMSRLQPVSLAVRSRFGPIAGSRHSGRIVLAAQAAVTVVVMISAGLFVRSYLRMISNDPGFDVDRVMAVNIAPIDQDNKTIVKDFYPSLLASITALSSVEVAGITNAFRAPGSGRMAIEGVNTLPIATRLVTPGALEALGVPVRQGRLPSAADAAACGNCVALSETAARRLFGEEIAVGRTVTWSGRSAEVLAVVADVNFSAPFKSEKPDVYVFTNEVSPTWASVVIRPRGPTRELLRRVPALVADFRPRAVLDATRTGTDLLDERVEAYRRNAFFAGIITVLALVMSCTGILAVTAQSVSRRAREMAIRIAVGGSGRAIVGNILRDSLVPTIVGIVAGLILAMIAARGLAGLLFDLAATDIATYAAVGTLLASCALIASYVPARRAAAVDPSATLKSE